ncbi:HAMP domain-containing histidine kinase [Paucibacter sp. TC2R-5]|uniref:sensor histidine kinase n=1 Tax=Paucibacter sp. TC2R-5 TaxID=2893555 RepID=UPI0021E4C97E|nr:HAMP domain-containing sensor histidine kinase [Paucibacter sp. TC2R-5]MCV2360369.1 HAMP domain-containing histidine kinase [Paucibacter sp. TC2R-5]
MKRSLGSRLIAALLLAFALIAVLVIAANYWTARSQLAESSNAAQLGSLLLKGLDELDDAAAATAALRGFAGELNLLRQQSGQLSGEVGLRLARPDGSLVYQSGSALQGLALPVGTTPLSRLDLAGRPHALYIAQGRRWSLAVLDPLPSDTELLQWLLGQVAVSLLIALPVLLLTLWLSVRSGLQPLRSFSRRVEGLDFRKDLRPLRLDLRYAELQPLARAFDVLLERLSEHLAKERAFLQDAAHELRTPLAALGAQAHVLLRSPDDASRAEAAQALQQGLQRTAHLGQQLLDLSALDPDRPGVHQRVDLCELAGEVLRHAHPDARRRGVSLSLQAPASLFWQGEPQPLQSILQNLVDNALRYGAQQVELQIAAAAGEPPGHFRLAVLDDGPGIAPEHREQIFDRFWRGPASGEPGSGLGLTIVSHALTRLGARLRLGDGLLGRGIGFYIELDSAQGGVL